MGSNWGRRAAAWALAAGLASAGCGGPPAGVAPVVDAEGTVTLEGKPLPRVRVTFCPTDGSDGPPVSADTDEGGHFRVVGPDGRPGVAVGRYRVTVEDVAGKDPSAAPVNSRDTGAILSGMVDSKRKPPRAPRAYADPDQTPLRAEVTEAGRSYNFSLKRRPDR